MRYARKTCAICGMPDTPHTKSGEPLWIHTRLDRHIVAAFKARHPSSSAPTASTAPPEAPAPPSLRKP